MATPETVRIVMRPKPTQREGKRTQYWSIGALLFTNFRGNKEGERVYHKRGKNKARNCPGSHEKIPSWGKKWSPQGNVAKKSNKIST